MARDAVLEDTPVEAFDSDIGQMREAYRFLQQALTDSENLLARRDRDYRRISTALKDLLASGNVSHVACIAANLDDDDCVCGLADRLFTIRKAIGDYDRDRDEEREEIKRMREKYRQFRAAP